MVLLNEILPIIKRANQCGWYVVVVSNQAGVARGVFSEKTLLSFTEHLKSILVRKGLVIDQWFNCPYLQEGSNQKFSKSSHSRKPNPGMLLQSMKDLHIDIAKSFMVGDKNTDIIQLDSLNHCIIGESPKDISSSVRYFPNLKTLVDKLLTEIVS